MMAVCMRSMIVAQAAGVLAGHDGSLPPLKTDPGHIEAYCASVNLSLSDPELICVCTIWPALVVDGHERHKRVDFMLDHGVGGIRGENDVANGLSSISGYGERFGNIPDLVTSKLSSDAAVLARNVWPAAAMF